MKTNTKKDAKEIIKRLNWRNPKFAQCVRDGKITLEDFAELVIVQFKAFNVIP